VIYIDQPQVVEFLDPLRIFHNFICTYRSYHPDNDGYLRIEHSKKNILAKEIIILVGHH